MAFADIALGQIKALRQPATPRNYEIWYAYATGHHPSLNQKINETLKQNGALSEADLDQIYETFLPPTRLTERIDSVGSKVKDEIEQVMAMIDAAAGTANSYTESLADMTETLGQFEGPRGAARDRREPGAHHQGDGSVQPAAGSAAQCLQARNQRIAGQSRGGAQREPDRSADPARQPQILRHHARGRHRRRAQPRTSRCR